MLEYCRTAIHAYAGSMEVFEKAKALVSCLTKNHGDSLDDDWV